ncbi:helix-turn-helix domain-containing protein [Clostridium argentinense]|nr:helix-turn-helix domain-containing protein [Clostridium argentinense]NFP50129.1 helix-turn-helix domain-containing protein [Clostridium argentinense]NFP72644.1 helix-turn-helix domain-containing protein [Clostridium argentinense]NFP77240.1 helix-turn-helix domain-containing protein [Clostridium argentinense]
MTSMEYKLLLYFVENPNRIFTEQQIYETE